MGGTRPGDRVSNSKPSSRPPPWANNDAGLDPTNSPHRTGGDNYPWCNPSRLRLEIFQADPASKILPPSLLSSSWRRRRRRRRHSCCRGMVVVVFGFRQCQSQRVILVVFGGSIAILLVELEWRNLFHGIIRRGSIIRIVIVILFVATWRQIDNIRLRHDTLFLSFSLFYLRSFVSRGTINYLEVQ